VAALGFLKLGIPREAFGPFADVVIFALLACAVRCKEGIFVDSLTAVGLLSMSCCAIRDFVIFRDFGYWAMQPPFTAIAFVVTGVFVAIKKEHMLVQAFWSLRGDRASYDAEWCRVSMDHNEAAALQRLEALTDQIAGECPPSQARQLNRVRSETTYRCEQRLGLAACVARWVLGRLSLADLSFHMRCKSDKSGAGEGGDELNCVDSIPSSVDPRSPVLCLDQLYSQALGVVEILHALCAQWAERAQGSLVSLERGESGVIEGQSMQEAARKWVQLRFLKSPQRAVRKVLTCYLGDASRVVDLCRARILFDRSADIAACLEGIRAAPAVRIVRVKNFMAAGHDSWRTAGFRVGPPLSLYSS
jgi:hypothetical protein